MHRNLLRDGIGWGILLWFIGYVLGILLYMVVSPSVIGWIIMPIGATLLLWVLIKKISAQSFDYYVKLAFAWTAIAVSFDYSFLVKVFNPPDGYYKLDVYLYYLFTFALPLLVGWRRSLLKRDNSD